MKTFDNDICEALESLRLPSGSSLRTVALRPEVSHNGQWSEWVRESAILPQCEGGSQGKSEGREGHVSRTNVNMLITKYKRTLCTKCFVWHTQCCAAAMKSYCTKYANSGYNGWSSRYVNWLNNELNIWIGCKLNIFQLLKIQSIEKKVLFTNINCQNKILEPIFINVLHALKCALHFRNSQSFRHFCNPFR